MLSNKKYRSIFILFTIFILLIPILFPLFHRGFFVSDDGEWMIIRLSAFYEAIRAGQFPTRFLMRLNQGYGYPVADFLYPLYLYMGVPIHVMGFSFINTVKILMGLSILGSVVFCYFWLRRIFAELPALVGAILFGFAPYHLLDLYVRGNLGELLALSLTPFVLWQIQRKSFFWLSVGTFLLLLSHNTLALFFLVVSLLVVLFEALSTRNKKNAAICFGAIFLGCGMAAFFWIPAIHDLKYTVFSTISVSDWSKYFANIFLVGLATYAIFIGALLLFLKKTPHGFTYRLAALFLFLGLFSTFMASEGSVVFWNILPVSFVQFPFRFLSITILSSAFLGAYVFSLLSTRLAILMSLVLVAVLSFSSWQYISSVHYIDKGEGFYATNLDTTTVKNEYMPRGVVELPISWPSQKVTAENAEIADLVSTPRSTVFTVKRNPQSSYATITVKTIFFPGWSATIDRNPLPIYSDNRGGLISLSIPHGTHRIQVVFGETPARIISDIISLLSIFILLGITFYLKFLNKYV